MTSHAVCGNKYQKREQKDEAEVLQLIDTKRVADNDKLSNDVHKSNTFNHSNEDEWELITNSLPANAVNPDHHAQHYYFPLIPGKGVIVRFYLELCEPYVGWKFTSDCEESLMEVSGVVYGPKGHWYSELIKVTRWAIEDMFNVDLFDDDVESILLQAEWADNRNVEVMRSEHVDLYPEHRFFFKVGNDKYYYVSEEDGEEKYEEENEKEEEETEEENEELIKNEKDDKEVEDEFVEDNGDEDESEEKEEEEDVNVNFCEKCRRLRALYRQYEIDCAVESRCHAFMYCCAHPPLCVRQDTSCGAAVSPEMRVCGSQLSSSSLASQKRWSVVAFTCAFLVLTISTTFSLYSIVSRNM